MLVFSGFRLPFGRNQFTEQPLHRNWCRRCPKVSSGKLAQMGMWSWVSSPPVQRVSCFINFLMDGFVAVQPPPVPGSVLNWPSSTYLCGPLAVSIATECGFVLISWPWHLAASSLVYGEIELYFVTVNKSNLDPAMLLWYIDLIPNDKTVVDISMQLTRHLSPQPLEIAETYHFHRRNQQPGEWVKDYPTEAVVWILQFWHYLPRPSPAGTLVCGVPADATPQT